MSLTQPVSHEYNLPIIREIPFSLSREYCDSLIEKFEQSDETYQGFVGNSIVDKNIKNSIDLRLDGPSWGEDTYILTQKLNDAADAWMREHHRMVNVTFPNGKVAFSGYQIQKTVPGKTGYVWHSDEAYFDLDETPMRRYVTYLWYLNDNDGYTEFLDRKVKPEAGKLLLFFADPSLIHRGIPPTTGVKYILTGWISTERFTLNSVSIGDN